MQVNLREYGEPSEVTLPEGVARALASTRLVDVIPAGQPGTWRLVPMGRVGAVSCGGLHVRVDPKVTINRIIFMLGYTMRGLAWQDSPVAVAPDVDVVQVLVDLFLRSALTALKPGMLQGYTTVEDALPVVRGRIRIDDQLKRRPGLLVPMEVTFDEFTVDIPENQILLAAITALKRNALVEPGLRNRLSALSVHFSGVSRLPVGIGLPPWRLTRLNRRYAVPLRLAELILANSSFEHRIGDVQVDGFVLDMPKIFEDFITCALRDALVPLRPGSAAIGQFRSSLDEDALVELRPDLVWLDEQERPLVVVDAKYKAEKPAGFPHADLYQALAYATTLGLRDAHLVYAKGNETVQSLTVRGSGIRLHAHAVDLAQDPSHLLRQISDLAALLDVTCGPQGALPQTRTMVT